MRRLADDLWVTESPLRFGGLEVGARMTAIRLPDETLWLHSPIAASDALVSEVAALGSVRQLVAPNRLHHLFIGDWKARCPDASVWVAPGLETKRPDLTVDGVLDDSPEAAWAGTIDQLQLAGFPMANEVVFFHRPSATLLATDLAFNLGPNSPPLTRLAFRLFGSYGRLSPTILERLMIRDREAFQASLEAILAWPFERVIVAHGDVVETGGRAQLVEGYRWLLGE